MGQLATEAQSRATATSQQASARKDKTTLPDSKNIPAQSCADFMKAL
jgi:hypothetical protein